MHRKHTTAEDGMQTARSVSHSGKTLRWYLSFRPVAVLAAAFAALLTTGLVAGSFAGVAAAATPHAALATSSLGYTSLPTPIRIADTRAGATDPATYAGKTLAEGTGLTVDIPASAAIPASASAVVVNITAINPTNAGFLTVYPGGGTLPTAANVTFTTGQTVGDNVTVGLGPDAATSSAQSFTVYNGPATGGGSVDFTADVAGYYNAGSGAGYVPISPTRVYDSRTASGLPGAGTTLTAGGTDNVTVAGGSTSIPASATAVALNVAITNPTASSFIDAYPTGATAPGTANQNFLAGETLSSQVIAGVGTGGQVTIGNHAGTVDIVVDVDGYYTASGGGLLTVLAQPMRLLDTRTLTPPGVAGGASGTAVLLGAGATAGVLSIADLPTTGNFLTAYATGATAPTAANVNFVPGNTYNVVENAAYAIASASGSVSILNGPSNAGTANIVVDEDGYFTAPATTLTVVAAPATLTTAAGQTSALTFTVMHLGQPVGNDPLTLSATGNPAAVCNDTNVGGAGPTTPVTGNTGVNGIGTHTYTGTATVGTCTISVTEATFGLTSTATITQAANNSVAVTAAQLTPVVSAAAPGTVAAPAKITTDAAGPPPVQATATITATVDGPAGAGAPVAGDTVNFTTTALTPGGCGSVTPASAATSAGGVATTTYSGTTGNGFCTVTATEATAGTGETGPAVGTVVIDNTTAGATTVLTESGPASIQANGTSTTTVTATTAPVVASDPVLLTATPSVAGACGTLSATTGTTNASGVASFTYTSSTTAGGTCTITAIEASNAAHAATAVISQTATNSVALTAAPANLTPNGTSTSTVTATVTSVGGTPVAGDLVSFAGVGTPTQASCGAFTPNDGTTNASGQVVVTYTSTTTAGFCAVTATESGTGSAGSAQITQ
jgi:hypothetical protein